MDGDMETVLNAWHSQLQNSSDDYDLDALPVHIMRTGSFQGLPGHEDLVDINRGLPIFNYGSTVVDMMENEFNDDYSWSGGVIPMPPKLANRTAKVNIPCSWDSEINTTTLNKFPQSGKPENKPFLLMKTHFEVKTPLHVTECTINSFLRDMPDISTQVFAENCTWTVWAVQAQGGCPCTCKLTVAIYKSGADKSRFTVECNRLSGDHEPFNQFYKSLRQAFYLEVPVLCRSSTIHDSFSASMGPLPCVEALSDADAKKELLPILRLASSLYYEDMIEASKMLCGFSCDEDIKQALCDSSCIDVLLRLTSIENPSLARQHAVTCLANLSQQHGPCQEALIDAGVLPVLLEVVSNGSYDTAELRREGARALANLSSRLAQRVVSTVGEQQLEIWFATVDDLTDERVRLHAIQARDELLKAY